MYYLSVDTETSGLLECEGAQVLELGAVLDNLEKPLPLDDLPTFHCYILHDVIIGQPYALQMNAEILRRIAVKEEGYQYLRPEEVGPKLKEWLEEQGLTKKYDHRGEASFVNAAGKNFSDFDKPFLNRLSEFKEHVQFSNRVLDPAIYYALPNDFRLPDLQTCLKRAGIDGIVTHTAVEDAKQVVQLIRRAMKVAPIKVQPVEEKIKKVRMKKTEETKVDLVTDFEVPVSMLPLNQQ